MDSSAGKISPLRASNLVLLLCLVSCAEIPREDASDSVRMVLQDQVDAWNAGDIDQYMTGYWRSDSTIFVSGGSRLSGYDSVLARYKRSYPDRDAMGTLSFEQLEVVSLSPSVMLARGIWRLDRKHDEPWGRFTLLLEPRQEGWRIVYDHTSSAN